MVVRPMTPSDSREVALLSNQLGYPSSASDIEMRLGTMTQGADYGTFVAETTDGRVAGWIHVYVVRLVEADAYAEIGGLVVDANTRGQGFGKALLAACEKWAIERCYSVMTVHSNMKRSEVPPFYEGMGYNIVKTQYVFHKGLA